MARVEGGPVTSGETRRRRNLERPCERQARQAYAADRERLREFVHWWEKVGPALEEQRHRQLRELDDEMARRMTLDLFELWQPIDSDEMEARQGRECLPRARPLRSRDPIVLHVEGGA